MTPIIKGSRDARFCLIQPVDSFDAERLESEYSRISEALKEESVMLAAFLVEDWNGDLSPWKADGISKRFDFEGNAGRTLTYIMNVFIPMLKHDSLESPDEVRFIIGGYSLAGLFSLWAAYQTDIFSACAAASPSVWFPGWISYAEEHSILTGHIYLSLGDKEEKVRHPVMRTVGDCIRRQTELLSDKDCLLRWNEGNHFTDPDIRSADAFIWCVRRLNEK